MLISPLGRFMIPTKSLLIALLVGLAIFPTTSTAQQLAQQLPELPPMPELPPKRPVGSVPMGDPADVPETKMDFAIAPGPFGPTWESIAEHYPAGDVEWLREAKFGIWVHFGAQSAGRSGDWYAKRMYMQDGRPGGKYQHYYDNHLKNYGHPSEVGYKDLLRNWNPDKFDPAEQVKLFHDAGARFLFIQAVHHDNFDNWDSKYQKWNSVNMGPKRDLLRQWTDAARANGMYWGAAFHHEYTWWWYQTAFGSDATGPKAGVPYDGNLTLADGVGKWWDGYDPRMLYTVDLREYDGLDVEFAPAKGIFTNHQDYAKWYATWWALRMMDVIENYDPDFLYTDGNSTQPFSALKSGTGMKSDAAQRVLAHFFNRTLARRGKVDTFGIVKFSPPRASIVNTQEGRIPSDIKTDQPWIGEVAVGDWFYRPGFVSDAGAVIHYLLENTARDGATAINVAQLPDGSLDEPSRQMLKEIGQWMVLNGEGIYGSKAWVRLGEGENGKLRVAPGGQLGRKQAEFEFTPHDFRFTVGKDGSLYAFCMMVPEPGTELKIASFGKQAGLRPEAISMVKLLGSDATLKWRQDDDGLVITCPDNMPLRYAAGFKIN
jgi:alpha-L-fucosidase